jgi:transcriptional regulator with XRE-family HTH domain
MQFADMSEHTPVTAQLKAAREAAGLSIREMARRLSMSSSGYSHYESPDRFKESVLPVPIARAIAQIMVGTPVDPATILKLTSLDLPPPGERPSPPRGFSETATPFELRENPVPPEKPSPLLHGLFGPRLATPATYLIHSALPAFALAPGDVVIVDLARLPHAGEIALVSIFDDETASAVTTLRRYLPPFLAQGDAAPERKPMRVDDPGVTVRYPVIGSIRGISH